jgi:hypothetical protein
LFATSPIRRFFLCPLAKPHQNLTVLVDGDAFGINELFLERLQLLVVEMKLELECPVGDPLAGPEQGHDLVKQLKKIHDGLSDTSSSALGLFHVGGDKLLGRSGALAYRCSATPLWRAGRHPTGPLHSFRHYGGLHGFTASPRCLRYISSRQAKSGANVADR